MGTAALIGGVTTKLFTGEYPKDVNDYIFPLIGGTNPDGSPRRLTTMFYLHEIPMLMKHIQEYGGGLGGTLSGAGAMLWSKLLFEPFIELWNNRNYFGSEIWGHQCPGISAIDASPASCVDRAIVADVGVGRTAGRRIDGCRAEMVSDHEGGSSILSWLRSGTEIDERLGKITTTCIIER
jgi:hypothetical protein